MLPGRMAELDSAWAWEKVICLTPRPQQARKAMRNRLLESIRAHRLAEAGRVDPSEEPALGREAELRLDRSYFFPVEVRVRGRTVSFRVPDTFLGGPASRDWGYTVVVTGADPRDRVDLGAVLGNAQRLSGGLFVLPVTEMPSADSFGGVPPGDDLFPPIVDLLQPRAGVQEILLSSYDLRTGSPAKVTGVVPVGVDPEEPR
jgi:hypothetical protein